MAYVDVSRKSSEEKLTLAFRSIDKALRTVRSHLGMDVAFVSEFIGDHRVFRYVDSDNDSAPIKPGDVIPLSVGYCLKVVTGQLPELIPDTSALPEAMAIPATREIPIGW